MQKQRLFLAFVALAGTLAAQTPTFTGVVNAASGIPPGFPNYAIAQGSIFLVYGSNLGAPAPNGNIVNPSTLPLPTIAGLAGTSITVTVSGTTVTAPMLFTIPTQIAAVLPSNTPVGTGTMTLTFNGKSGTTPVTVLPSAFGISNANTGVGPSIAAVTFGTNQAEFVSYADAAAPGDVLILFGTGLGPVPSGVSDTGLPTAVNIGATPTVYVGGVASPLVTYYGRSPCCVGIDQIAFTVPQNAPLGCQVSIVVQTSNGTAPIVSNGPTTAIAQKSHTACTDPVDAFPPTVLSKASTKVLALPLKQTANINSTPTGTTSSITAKAQAFVLQFSQAQLAALASTNVEATQGSCFTGIIANSSSGGSAPAATYLNAGSSVTLTPPSGAPIVLPAVQAGAYQNTTITGIPSGTWSFANSGGSDLGALSFNFPVPQPIVWTNQAALLNSTVTRANGLTINWTGGDQNGYVDIQGSANNLAGNFQVVFDCSAPITAGSFTIPPSILLAMPTGGSAMASLQVSTYSYPFTLPLIAGFDAGINLSQIQVNIPLSYK